MVHICNILNLFYGPVGRQLSIENSQNNEIRERTLEYFSESSRADYMNNGERCYNRPIGRRR